MHSKCFATCRHRCDVGLGLRTGFEHLGGGITLFILALCFYGALRRPMYDHLLFASTIPIFYFAGWTASELNTTGVWDWHGLLWPIAGVLGLAAVLLFSGALNVCTTCSFPLRITEQAHAQ